MENCNQSILCLVFEGSRRRSVARTDDSDGEPYLGGKSAASCLRGDYPVGSLLAPGSGGDPTTTVANRAHIFTAYRTKSAVLVVVRRLTTYGTAMVATGVFEGGERGRERKKSSLLCGDRSTRASERCAGRQESLPVVARECYRRNGELKHTAVGQSIINSTKASQLARPAGLFPRRVCGSVYSACPCACGCRREKRTPRVRRFCGWTTVRGV